MNGAHNRAIRLSVIHVVPYLIRLRYTVSARRNMLVLHEIYFKRDSMGRVDCIPDNGNKRHITVKCTSYVRCYTHERYHYVHRRQLTVFIYTLQVPLLFGRLNNRLRAVSANCNGLLGAAGSDGPLPGVDIANTSETLGRSLPNEPDMLAFDFTGAPRTSVTV